MRFEQGEKTPGDRIGVDVLDISRSSDVFYRQKKRKREGERAPMPLITQLFDRYVKRSIIGDKGLGHFSRNIWDSSEELELGSHAEISLLFQK